MEILDGSNGSRRLQIEFLRNGETGQPFVKLRGVRIDPGAREPFRPWVGPSLLSAFAMMIVEDLSGSYRVRLCSVCDTPFPSAAYQARYCSLTCQWRAQMRQYRAGLRERKKKRRKKVRRRP